MYRSDSQDLRGLRSWSGLFIMQPAVRVCISTMVGMLLAGAIVAPAAGQAPAGGRARGPSVGAGDLIAIQEKCGAADPLDASFQIIQKHVLGGTRSGGVQIMAFEENPHFIYVLAARSGRRPADGEDRPAQQTPRRVRRFFLLKPSTFVVEDIVRPRAARRAVSWRLRSSGEPQIEERRIRLVQGEMEIAGETLLPEAAIMRKASRSPEGDQNPEHQVEVRLQEPSDEVRFLQVFHLRGASEKGTSASSKMVKGDDGSMRLAVTTEKRIFRLTLPAEFSTAGELEIAETGGNVPLPRRLLPSGIMPHGPEGCRLLERWDSPYRRSGSPGWDVGRPSSALVQAVKDGVLPRGRAIVLGCGTGTNAIYLAGQGFEVTGVDVAPTALNLAREKARKAGVGVRWMVADVLALPPLEPVDLIFDRGCYHHVRQYNAAGYVETTRRLSHPGTRLLILAGSAKQTGRGGPPRVKEEEIRGDFSGLFEFEWLREIRFDRPDPGAQGPLAWSVLMKRKSD